MTGALIIMLLLPLLWSWKFDLDAKSLINGARLLVTLESLTCTIVGEFLLGIIGRMSIFDRRVISVSEGLLGTSRLFDKVRPKWSENIYISTSPLPLPYLPPQYNLLGIFLTPIPYLYTSYIGISVPIMVILGLKFSLFMGGPPHLRHRELLEQRDLRWWEVWRSWRKELCFLGVYISGKTLSFSPKRLPVLSIDIYILIGCLCR